MKLKILIVTLGHDAARASTQANACITSFKKRIRIATSADEATDSIRCWRPNYVITRARLPKQRNDPELRSQEPSPTGTEPMKELALSLKLHGFSRIWSDCLIRKIPYGAILCESDDYEALHFLDSLEEPNAPEGGVNTWGNTTLVRVPRPHSEGHQIQWNKAIEALEVLSLKTFRDEPPNKHLSKAIRMLRKQEKGTGRGRSRRSNGRSRRRHR